MESQESVLTGYGCWLVNDYLGGYFHFKNASHAVSCTHQLRDLQGLVESRKSAWTEGFENILLSIYNMPHEERGV